MIGAGTAGAAMQTAIAQARSGDDGADDDTPDYAAFKACIRHKTGIDLSQYKAQQMRRRLTSLLERAQTPTFEEYFRLLERDADEWNVFLDRLTINVSELFRNPEKWEELRRPVLTEWLAPGSPASAYQGQRPFKAWSAGCSYGAEPYTLAILLDQARMGARAILHATDLDRAVLARAAQGRFTQADVKNVAPDVLNAYFTPIPASHSTPDITQAGDRRGAGGDTQAPGLRGAACEMTGAAPARTASAVSEAAWQVRADIGRRVQFRPHNLLADAFETGYDLICCRNVVIYFTETAKQTLYKRFQQALRVGGVLFVGGTERIFNFQELGFDMPLPFFYRRVR